MDLWIRSQTKIGLMKTNDKCIRSVLHKKDIDDTEKLVWQILANNEIVAEYCTKERALEVLDEIQKLLIGDVLAFKNFDAPNDDYLKSAGIDNAIVYHSFTDDSKQVDFLHRDCVVYKMPEEQVGYANKL